MLARSGKSASPSFQFGCLVLRNVFFQFLESIVLDSSSHPPVLVALLFFYFPFSALFPALTPLMAAGDVIQALITALQLLYRAKTDWVFHPPLIAVVQSETRGRAGLLAVVLSSGLMFNT